MNTQRPQTLFDLLAVGDPSHPALMVPEGGPAVTYRSLRNQVEGLAATLHALGLGRGDRVAMALSNGIEVITAFFGITAAAATAAPLNPAYTAEEFRFYLEDIEAKALIVPPGGGEQARVAAPAGTLLIEAVLTTNGQVRFDVAGSSPLPRVQTDPAPDDVALFLHTSGTTSRPKGVPKAHRATWYTAVPTIHQVLLARADEERAPAPGTSGLRFIRSCSSALAPATMAGLEARFGCPVLEAYGMTEAAHQMASNPLPPAPRRPGSVGRGTGVQVAIMDEAGTLLAVGAQGEVVIQGPNVTHGYHNNPEANAATFTHGWFRTGDQGVLDADGYLTLVGRLKELINRGGEKISPREIDEVLLTHPAVAEAVCFGVPDTKYGEEVAAAVVLRGDASEADLIAHCRDRLAAFKAPKTIYLIAQVPRTATGKIQRRAVAAAVANPASRLS